MEEEVFASRDVPVILLPPEDKSNALSRNQSIRSRHAPIKLASSAPYPQAQSLLAENTLTASQKDLVLRVIDAAEKLKLWCETIDQWGWTGSFAPPSTHTDSVASLVGNENAKSNSTETEYWGCLPSKLVEKYESQLDLIHEEMEKLDLDDLKERILGIHLDNSRPSSRASMFSTSRLGFLDDFTFFVTKTLLQFLPILSKLNRLMKVWSTRLVVLRIVPNFLYHLRQVKVRIHFLWNELDLPVERDEKAPRIEEARLDQLREYCKKDVSDAGRLLDSMLDLLESFDDVLPDTWIDDFETVEADLGTWSLAAERKLFELKTRQYTNGDNSSASAPHVPDSKPEEVDHTGQLRQPLNGEVAAIASASLSDHSHTALAANGMPTAVESITWLDEVPLSESISPVEFKVPMPQTTTETVCNVNNRISSSTRSDSHGSRGDLSSPSPAHSLSDTENLPSTQPSSPIVPNPEVSGLSDATIHRGNFSDSLASSADNDAENPTLLQDSAAELQMDSSYPEEYLEVDDLPLEDLHIESLPSVELPTEILPIDKTVADDTVIRHEQDHTSIRSASDQDISMLSAMSGTSMLSEENDSEKDEPDDTPSRRVARVPVPPLNAMIKKRQNKTSLPSIVTIPDNSTLGDPKSPNDVLPSIETSTPLHSPISPVIPLQERISSILEAIPTPIRLKSGPAANAPDVKRHRARTPSLTLGRRPNSHNQHPNLTLAPADEAVPRRTNPKDPDIRIYHLIHTGRDKPIKLFIRRVGENGERVMVRVGGGWADLGEYLRIYVEHHGRRATSDGRVEIQPINATTGSPTPKPTGSRRSSLLGPANSFSTPGSQSQPTGVGRPESALGTPIMHSNSSSSDTPQSQPSGASRRSVTWGEASLAGPYAKRGEVSGEKQEWIDGIVEQAKKSMGKKVEVGDLGKTGATRRIFFKGRSATPTSRADTPTDGRAGTPIPGRRSATPNHGRPGTSAPDED
jgi:hypothetical protein